MQIEIFAHSISTFSGQLASSLELYPLIWVEIAFRFGSPLIWVNALLSEKFGTLQKDFKADVKGALFWKEQTSKKKKKKAQQLFILILDINHEPLTYDVLWQVRN